MVDPARFRANSVRPGTQIEEVLYHVGAKGARGKSDEPKRITGRFTRSARRSASGPMPGASNAVRDSSRCRKMARSSWRS